MSHPNLDRESFLKGMIATLRGIAAMVDSGGPVGVAVVMPDGTQIGHSWPGAVDPAALRTFADAIQQSIDGS